MRIKEMREQAGITQQNLGQQMNVRQSTVSSWETEAALPNARELPRLAQALGCSIGKLFVQPEDEAS